ncbi:MAG: tetratricopeptide repeat protein, partial [Planctomycetota bacterium]
QPRVAARIEAARRAVLDAPSSADAWGRLGAVCDAHRLHEPARTCYERAHRLAPTAFQWPYLLAIVRDVQGADASEVTGLFETAIAIERRFPPVHVRYGDALVRHGRSGEAAAAYRAALALDEDFAMAHRSLGRVLLSLGDLAGAVTHLERAAGLNPGDSLAYSSLAQAYTRQGDATRAEAATARARMLTPDLDVPDPIRFDVEALGISSELCAERAHRMTATGDWQGVVDNLSVVAEVRPDDAEVRRQLGGAYARLGRTEPALRHLAEAVRLQDDLATARVDLAALLLADGRAAEAATHLQRAVDLDPTSALTHERLALVLEHLGRATEAAEHRARAAALRREGDDPDG